MWCIDSYIPYDEHYVNYNKIEFTRSHINSPVVSANFKSKYSKPKQRRDIKIEYIKLPEEAGLAPPIYIKYFQGKKSTKK